MYKPFINPVIPRPIPIETVFLKGKLFIEGSLEHNYIRFRFQFDEKSETSPVTVFVQAAGKEYAYNCVIVDYSENEAKTAVFRPEYFIGSRFDIINIEPLVKFIYNEKNQINF